MGGGEVFAVMLGGPLAAAELIQFCMSEEEEEAAGVLLGFEDRDISPRAPKIVVEPAVDVIITELEVRKERIADVVIADEEV